MLNESDFKASLCEAKMERFVRKKMKGSSIAFFGLVVLLEEVRTRRDKEQL